MGGWVEVGGWVGWNGGGQKIVDRTWKKAQEVGFTRTSPFAGVAVKPDRWPTRPTLPRQPDVQVVLTARLEAVVVVAITSARDHGIGYYGY